MAVSLAERRQVLEELSTVAFGDLVRLWRDSAGMSSAEFVAWMTDAVPELVDPFASVSGDLAAEWYDESAPSSEYVATPAELPGLDQLRGSTEWALGASGDDALSRLAGVAQRAIWNTARNTIFDNAKSEGARWVRVSAHDACAWCAMMTTRGAVYLSHGSAHASGHDHCRCQLREIRPEGDGFDPPAYLSRFDDAYRAASRAQRGPLDTKAVLAEMRTILGTN